MDVRESSTCLALTLVLSLAGCASIPAPEAESPAGPAMPPQTVTPAAPSPPEPGVEDPVAAPPRSPHTVVIDEGTPESPKRSLAEAAEEERRRRQTAPRAVVTVTDKNLQDHATGNLTFSSPGPETGGAGEQSEASETGELDDEADRERYWRKRIGDHREEWADAVDEIFRLEQEVSELRLRFYAEDDPYVRDARIKPEWDRSLDRLADTRRRAERLEKELGDILEEGRRAGAFPGWLRERYELEPEERPYGEHLERREDEAIIGEPVIVDEDYD